MPKLCLDYAKAIQMFGSLAVRFGPGSGSPDSDLGLVV